MLLGDWNDLASEEAHELEMDHHSWAVQPKLDGCRVLLHVSTNEIRITGRTVSEVTYRLTEHQDNVPHLAEGLENVSGTIVDGELVCPVSRIDTGSTITESPLQAVVAILSTTPDNAKEIQSRQDVHAELHVFDVLRRKGLDVTQLPLCERLELLNGIIAQIRNPFIRLVPTGVVGKQVIHDRVIGASGEGTVWKKLDQPYEPGRRVRHWLKRKRGIEIEAFVSGFKPGSADRGHRYLIGAVEFSKQNGDGTTRPVAWVSTWTEHERKAMTIFEKGTVQLNPSYLGRTAILIGQEQSARSHRIRHARLKKWVAPS